MGRLQGGQLTGVGVLAPNASMRETDGGWEGPRPEQQLITARRIYVITALALLICGVAAWTPVNRDASLFGYRPELDGVVREGVDQSSRRACVCKVDCTCASNACCQNAMKKAGLLPKTAKKLPKGAK